MSGSQMSNADLLKLIEERVKKNSTFKAAVTNAVQKANVAAVNTKKPVYNPHGSVEGSKATGATYWAQLNTSLTPEEAAYAAQAEIHGGKRTRKQRSRSGKQRKGSKKTRGKSRKH